MQGLMSNYIEQSASAFLQMQNQFQQQTRDLFSRMPFSGTYPGAPSAGDKAPDDDKKG
jgi:polyhydroxyalkanoate synthesis regulator protein